MTDVVSARFVAAARAPEELPPPVSLELAFAGRSNVGKSSLLNRLMGRKNLARTSSTPGCTRAVTFFEIKTRDHAMLTLVDLPGYGYAKRSKAERRAWGPLVEEYLAGRASLGWVVLLVDARRGLQADDLDLWAVLSEPRPHRTPPRLLLVATKLDQVPRSRRASTLTALRSPEREVLGFSTELPETWEGLWKRLRSPG